MTAGDRNTPDSTLGVCARRYTDVGLAGIVTFSAGLACFGLPGLPAPAAGTAFAGLLVAVGFRSGLRERLQSREAFADELARVPASSNPRVVRVASALSKSVFFAVVVVALALASAHVEGGSYAGAAASGGVAGALLGLSAGCFLALRTL